MSVRTRLSLVQFWAFYLWEVKLSASRTDAMGIYHWRLSAFNLPEVNGTNQSAPSASPCKGFLPNVFPYLTHGLSPEALKSPWHGA
jgi:hypothetical protein